MSADAFLVVVQLFSTGVKGMALPSVGRPLKLAMSIGQVLLTFCSHVENADDSGIPINFKNLTRLHTLILAANFSNGQPLAKHLPPNLQVVEFTHLMPNWEGVQNATAFNCTATLMRASCKATCPRACCHAGALQLKWNEDWSGFKSLRQLALRGIIFVGLLPPVKNLPDNLKNLTISVSPQGEQACEVL